MRRLLVWLLSLFVISTYARGYELNDTNNLSRISIINNNTINSDNNNNNNSIETLNNTNSAFLLNDTVSRNINSTSILQNRPIPSASLTPAFLLHPPTNTQEQNLEKAINSAAKKKLKSSMDVVMIRQIGFAPKPEEVTKEKKEIENPVLIPSQKNFLPRWNIPDSVRQYIPLPIQNQLHLETPDNLHTRDTYFTPLNGHIFHQTKTTTKDDDEISPNSASSSDSQSSSSSSSSSDSSSSSSDSSSSDSSSSSKSSPSSASSKDDAQPSRGECSDSSLSSSDSSSSPSSSSDSSASSTSSSQSNSIGGSQSSKNSDPMAGFFSSASSSIGAEIYQGQTSS